MSQEVQAEIIRPLQNIYLFVLYRKCFCPYKGIKITLKICSYAVPH